jgi:hypothetical protein
MANELLDFVMGLVRDPDAAARYAADPAQAIADAQLADVTSVDVNNLIPMVSESLSMAAPTLGADTTVDQAIESNVWTSGAATAAFDAFAPLAPTDLTAHSTDIGGVIDTAAPETAPALANLEPVADTLLVDESALFTEVPAEALDAHQPAPWEQSATDSHAPDHAPSSFDLFD